ncbi:hypothetical protein [Ruminococcus sp.]|uniref:hypothetical protein n=1 Tax=Ruminococcus sp. TaxID=41978 RepID=UPI0025F0E6F6|nr:hypothetical protein [Ruminococcus sp.]
MNKFIISIITLISTLSFVLWFGIKQIPDNGIFRHGDHNSLNNCSALFVICGLEHNYLTAEEYEQLIQNYKSSFNIDELDILYVTSTNDNSYSVRSANYSFSVDKVIKGKDYLNNKSIVVQTFPESLFQELDENALKRLGTFFDTKGFSKDTHPWLYTNKEVCYSFTSVPKEGEHYIIFVGEIRYSDEKEPLYLLLDDMLFTEADVSNDKLLKYEDVPIYKNYADNYTFFFRQEDLDWYIKLRNDIFKHYLNKQL